MIRDDFIREYKQNISNKYNSFNISFNNDPNIKNLNEKIMNQFYLMIKQETNVINSYHNL